MRAWFNGRTSPCQGLGPGSIPGARTNEKTPIIMGVFSFVRARKQTYLLSSGNRKTLSIFMRM